MGQAGRKPKNVFSPRNAFTPARAGEDLDDFAVYATYRVDHGRFVGSLTVIRKTDGRRLFPFDGSGTIGPFDSKEQALNAAAELGAKIVQADIANPEL